MPDFTDYMYKLEQNINNEITAIDNRKNRNISSETAANLNITSNSSRQASTDIDCEKPFEPLLLSWSLKKNYYDLKDDLYIERNNTCNTKKVCKSDIKSEFIPLDKFVANSNNTHKQLTQSEAEQTLNECRQSILETASPSMLLYASYLLSITGVISLLRPRLDDE